MRKQVDTDAPQQTTMLSEVAERATAMVAATTK